VVGEEIQFYILHPYKIRKICKKLIKIFCDTLRSFDENRLVCAVPFFIAIIAAKDLLLQRINHMTV